jgi:uncharacterized protein
MVSNSDAWSGRPDLNRRPSAPKADALPDCATPRAAPQTFEDAAFSSSGGGLSEGQIHSNLRFCPISTSDREMIGYAMFDQTPERGGSGRVPSVNVLGGLLQVCSAKPLTGFFRDGCCNTGQEDHGLHTVCVVMTEPFLTFCKAQGNDLSTPMPQYGFAGLKPGDRWCLCAIRWKEAFEAGHAPDVVLEATHAVTLQVVSLDALKKHAAPSV